MMKFDETSRLLLVLTHFFSNLCDQGIENIMTFLASANLQSTAELLSPTENNKNLNKNNRYSE